MFTKYKLQRNSKLNEYYIKQKLRNSHSKIHNSAGTSSVRPWTPGTVAARGLTRRRENRRKMGWPGSVSPSFPLPANGEELHHLQQQQKRTNSRV
jgi:hypothetical protein